MRNEKQLKKLAIILGAVVLVLAGANVFLSVAGIPPKDNPAPQSNEITTPVEVQAPGPAPTTALKVGDTFTSGNWQYTVTKVDQPPTVISADARSNLAAQGTWRVVEVKAVNVGNDPLTIGPDDFQIRDAANNIYQASGQLGWPGGSCLPGGAVTVELVFDVSQDASGAILFLPTANQSVDLGQ